MTVSIRNPRLTLQYRETMDNGVPSRRFSDDLMLQRTPGEVESLRSQFVISNAEILPAGRGRRSDATLLATHEELAQYW